MLVTISDVLDAAELASARALMARAPWTGGSHTAGPQAAQVKRNRQIAEGSAELAELRTLVLDALQRNAQFFAAALPQAIAPPNFNAYGGADNPGGNYGFHADSALRRLPASPGYLRADISATLFFSEPDEYEGGELVIADTFGEHGIKLAAGSLVVYPSSSIHAVTPVTRGERRACFLFIQSLVRDAGQRRLLYDMDMALLELRQQLGDTAPLISLTGGYHNLLRRWAEP